MTVAEKKIVPSEIVFAKSAGETVDLNIQLSLDAQGEWQQSMSTMVGQTLNLAVKPVSAVRSVKGYVVFREKNATVVQADIDVSLSKLISSALFAEPALAEPARVIEERMVLQEFEYTDPDGDGIYTALVASPRVDGKYDIITVMDYLDPALGKKEIRLVTVVDPEGYVYENVNGQDLHIKNATVEMWWQNPTNDVFEFWPAKNFQQINPQITDRTGRYSFLVPEGTYRLRVSAKGYHDYTGQPFLVQVGAGIHANIELFPEWSFWKRYGWLGIIPVGILVVLIYTYTRHKSRKVS